MRVSEIEDALCPYSCLLFLTFFMKRKIMANDNSDCEVEEANTLYDSSNTDYLRLENGIMMLSNSLEEVRSTLGNIQNRELEKDRALAFISKIGRA